MLLGVDPRDPDWTEGVDKSNPVPGPRKGPAESPHLEKQKN